MKKSDLWFVGVPASFIAVIWLMSWLLRYPATWWEPAVFFSALVLAGCFCVGCLLLGYRGRGL